MQQRTQSTNNPPQIVVGPCVSLVDATRSMVLVIVLCLGWRLGMRPYLDYLADLRCHKIEVELQFHARYPFAIYQYRELFGWGFISDSPRYRATIYKVVSHLPGEEREAILRQWLWVAKEMDLTEHAHVVESLNYLSVGDRDGESRRDRMRAALRAAIGWCRRFEAETDAEWVHDPHAGTGVSWPPFPLTTGVTLNPAQWYSSIVNYRHQFATARRLQRYHDSQVAYLRRGGVLSAMSECWPLVLADDAPLRDDCMHDVEASGLSRELQDMLLGAILKGEKPERTPYW